MTARPEDSPDSLRHTLNRYRIPLIVVTIGVALSIAGFSLTLNAQTESLKKDFLASAAREAALIDDRFLLFQEKTRGVLALFEASEKVDEAQLNRFVQPMMARVPFEMIG